MPRNKQKFLSDVTKIKHFLLGAGLVLTLVASTSFAQEAKVQCGSLGGQLATQAECDAADKASGKTMLPSGEVMKPCAPGQSPSPGNACAPGGAMPTNLQSGPTTGTSQISTPQQPTPPSQPNQPSGPPPFSAQSLESAIAGGQLTADTQIPCPPLNGQVAKASDCLSAAKGQTSQQQTNVSKPTAEEKSPAIDKSKLSPAKNPAAVNAAKGVKDVDKVLKNLSGKFAKAKTRIKKDAVIRGVAANLPKLCKKYVKIAQNEEIGDEDTPTCPELVADWTEPIIDALKLKDVDSAFNFTYDSLINLKSLIQQ